MSSLLFSFCGPLSLFFLFFFVFFCFFVFLFSKKSINGEFERRITSIQ